MRHLENKVLDIVDARCNHEVLVLLMHGVTMKLTETSIFLHDGLSPKAELQINVGFSTRIISSTEVL